MDLKPASSNSDLAQNPGKALDVRVATSPLPSNSLDPGSLALLSLQEQLQWISNQLSAIECRCPPGLEDRVSRLSLELTALGSLCVGLLDSAPLAHLLRALCARGLLDEGLEWDAALLLSSQKDSGFSSFVAVLSMAPDTFLLKLVRVLVEGAADSAEGSRSQRSAAVVLARLQAVLPFSRLPARCVVDRALQRHFPVLRGRLLEGAQDRILSWAESEDGGAAGALGSSAQVVSLDRVLAAGLPLEDASLCSAAQLEALLGRLKDPTRQRLQLLKRCVARCTLEVLASQPRGVSQANAEELLSRRVYTDPGHFLIELLQNAEDARAHRWSVRFEPDRVVVAHDGQPFDCRDVVGITSIGQTTKVQQQIGMFGVGFKSVYEVTQRPRIHSGDFSFELVDVSVPRTIEASTLGFPDSWTVIELPLANSEDESRSPARLFERACLLDPCVLLTLKNLEQVELSLVGPVSSTRRIRRVLEGEQAAISGSDLDRGAEQSVKDSRTSDFRSTLRLARYCLETHELELISQPQSPSSSTDSGGASVQTRSRPYLLLESLRPYDRTLREPERRTSQVEATRIVLGFELDEGGLPRALQPAAAQLFSWLPTAEKPGLRFFIQAHFDVPVDRERVSPGSAFNRWVVAQVAPLLSEALPLVRDDATVNALLECLPLQGELKDPLFGTFPDTLQQALAQSPVLTSYSGAKVAPAQTWVLEDALVPLLRPDQQQVFPTKQLLKVGLSRRLVTWVLQAGACRFGLGHLIAQLEADSSGNQLKELLPGGEPVWSGIQVLLEILGEHPELGRFLLRIRRLKCIPDAHDVPQSPANLSLGCEEIREVYKGSYVNFIHPKLDRLMDADCSSRVSSFLQALELPVLDEQTLASDLSGGRTFERSIPGLIALHQRLASRLEAFSPKLWRTMSLVAVWPDQRGTLRPLVGAQRVLIPGRKAVAALFKDAPILDPRVAELPHIQATQLPRASLTQVMLALLPQANPPLKLEATPETLKQVLSLVVETLEEAADEVTPTVRSILSTQPFLLTHQDRPATLSMLVKVEDPALGELISEVTEQPLVGRGSLTDTVIGEVGLFVRRLDTVGAWSLILESRLRVFTPPQVHAIRQLLIRDAGQLPQALLVRVLALPIFPDASGACGPVTGLNGGGAVPIEPTWRSSFSYLGARVLAAEEQEALSGVLAIAGIQPLGLVALLKHMGALQLDLLSPSFRPFFETPHLDWFHSQLLVHLMLLQEHFPAMSREGQPPGNVLLCALPLWRSQSGAVQCADRLLEPPRPELELDFLLHDTEIPSPASLETLRKLKHLVPLCPLSLHLQHLLLEQAQAFRGIDDQPAALNSPTRLARILAHQLVATVREPWHAAPLVLPLLDALGRLRLDSLKLTDLETTALLLKLRPKDGGSGGSGTSQRSTPMHPLAGQLLHPVLAGALGNPPPSPLMDRLIPLSVREVAQALTVAHLDADDLPALWDWLGNNLPKFTLDSESLKALGAAPLFLTAGGRRVHLAALSADPRLQNASGLDVLPAPVLGLERVARLQALLYPGRGGGSALVLESMLPLWQEWSAQGDEARVKEALHLLAAVAADEGAGFSLRLRTAAKASFKLLLPDEQGHWRPLAGLLAPDPALRERIRTIWGSRAPMVAQTVWNDQVGDLLRSLELPGLPSLELLSWAGTHARPTLEGRRALCQLISEMSSDAETSGNGEAWAGWSIFCQQGLPWLLDGTGAPRAPHDLFASAPELEGLIGSAESHPERFVHPELEHALGRRAISRLPLLRERDINLSHVVAELVVQSSLKHPVGFRIYRWLEAGLRERRLDPAEVSRALSGIPWICTDDGEWFEPARVLGVPAWVCFGRFRGYWQRGIRECPRLCELFGISDTLSVDIVLGFLRELGLLVQQQGDQALLACETALPRMLLACCALLGQQQTAIPEGLPVILAEAMGRPAQPGLAASAGALEPPGTRRLLTRGTAGLVRSATPSLESIFAHAGRYYRAVLGPPEEREAVEACLERSGVPRLAEMLQLELAAEAGQERTQERLQSIRGLRSVLHHLLEVLPRVRRQRSWLEPSGWRYEQRLRLLTLSAPIRVFEGLTVSYLFPGVGRVQVRSAALLEPDWSAAREPLLALDEETIQNPLETIGELASALVPAVYEGAGAEQLVDILELLIPLGSLERMNRYLDQRHYPVASRQVSPVERLRERWAALLDFGLQRSLTRAFPWLEAPAIQEGMRCWSDPAALRGLVEAESIAEEDSSNVTRLAMHCAHTLIEMAGIAQEAPDREALQEVESLLGRLFLEPDLSRAVSQFWAVAGERPAGEGAPGGFQAQASSDLFALDDLPFGGGESLEDMTGPGGHSAQQPSGSAGQSWWQNLLGGILPEGNTGGISSASVAAQGVLRRLGRFLGSPSAEHVSGPAVEVSRESDMDVSNPFFVMDRIGDNRWATPERRKLLASLPLPAWIRHEPRKLVSPWAYAIRSAGGHFDPNMQIWQGAQGIDLLALQQGDTSAGRVLLEGTFLPGRNLLPIPMFSRLIRPPQVDGASAPLAVKRGRQGGLELEIDGSAPVTVRFQVQLLQPPVLGPGVAEGWGSLSERTLHGLKVPTLPREKLPFRLRRQLSGTALMKAPLWERAFGALELVRGGTLYDEDWQSQPRVQAVEPRLRAGEGQHALERFFAGGDTELIGRGICFELNLFLVEVLRHLEVPALPATGWLLDEGLIGRSDHLFALVILPGPEGPVLMPLDASIGPDGARSALRGIHNWASQAEGHTITGGSPVTAPPLLPSGLWALTAQVRSQESLSVGSLQRRLETEVRQGVEEELVALAEAHALLKRALGGDPGPHPKDYSGKSLQELQARAREQRQTLEQIVGDGQRAALLLKLVKDELPAMSIVTPEIQELLRMGVARLRTQSLYQVVRMDRS